MKYAGVLVLLMVSQVVYVQSESEDSLTQANVAYLNRDYRTAQSLYENLIEDGARDPAINFNLGNAYYQTGDLGRALLNYRRAQQFWPRDPDLNSNLARVRSERVDLLGDETGFLEGLASLTDNILTVLELSILVGLLWTIWFMLLGVMILKSSSRSSLRQPLIVLGVFLLIGLFLLGSRLYLNSYRRLGVVVEQVVQVRSGPGETYLELYPLHAAAELHVWETRNGWIQFALADGRLGWVPSQVVETVTH